MGGTTSRETDALRAKKNVRYYRPPNVRQKDRFDAVDNTSTTTSFEASIDKYDYLIVFPLTEGPFADPADVSAPGERVSWADCKNIWRQAVPGTDDAKARATQALANFWEKRTGSDPEAADSVLLTAWQTISREAIVHQLSTKSGLQLKLSAHKKFIYCRVRAPIKLLEVQADRENYRLQFRGEIDPGSEEFWNLEVMKAGEENPVPVELEDEKAEYGKDEANMILEKLYRAGKISPNDLGVNPAKENATTWSRRVHALERIADRVPIWNKYTAYSQFSTRPEKRYLYQPHQSVRGKTLFRAKDRIFLTKSVIDRYFDFGVFQEYEVVDCMMPLHDANRGDRLTIDVLQRRWVSFWRVTAREVGSPMVTAFGYEETEEVLWLLRPFSQPLLDIREYFGEKVSLYFAWLGYYTMCLLFPTILGAGLLGVYAYRGYEDTINHIDGFMVAFLILMVGWCAAYKQGWDRECSAVALKWGTKGFEEEEKDRPQFRGDPDNPLARSFVTNRIETNFPPELRFGRSLLAMIAIFFMLVLDLSLIGGVFYAESLVMNTYTQYDFSGLMWVVSFILALLSQISSILYLPIAGQLNDMENHRTETQYEDALILKILLFQVFNNYAATIFTAFGKDYFLGSCDPDYGCMEDLRTILYAIIIVRTAINLWQMGWPVTRGIINDYFFKREDEGGDEKEESAAMNADPDDDTNFIKEHTDRDSFEGVLGDYAEAVLQFGYISMFSTAMPILGLVALGENLIKIRADAWRLCSYTRRPNVLLAEDVGMWGNLMDIMSLLGVIVSVGVIVFTDTAFGNYTFYEKLILFLAADQVVLIWKFFVQWMIPAEPEWVEDIQKRNEFIVDKFYNGIDDDDDDLDSGNVKGNLVDTIDVDGVNLYDLRKAKNFTEEEYAEMESLEGKRRDLLNELRLIKDQLQTVYKTETLNENTGVGETKHGLPLGRLNIKLVEIQRLQGEDLATLGKKPVIKVRVIIRGTRPGGQAAGPPVGPRSDSTPCEVRDGTAVLNQSLGPYAPIRTQDADVIFEIIDMNPIASEASIATTSIKLRDLQDQQTHDKVLHLKLRLDSGELKQSDARLFVSLSFQYSKVVPIRNRIYEVQDKLRIIEKELATIKAGKKNLTVEDV